MSRDIFDDAPARERNFASDNNAGICPEVAEILAECNHGHAPGYGDDVWTQRACDKIRELLETDCEVFFVFNGTAANSLILATFCQPYHGILCHDLAHTQTDECGAPEFYTGGSKVIPLAGVEGRLSAECIEEAASMRDDLHFPKVRMVSLTQATELGTVYAPNDLRSIGEACRRRDLKLHLDGARLANAVATLEISPGQLIREAGADALSFGATKNGAAVGDAVVFFDKEAAREFEYRCKQAGQLASKMRYLAAPWVSLLENELWLRNARHANLMAEKLHGQLTGIPQVRTLAPREANSVFVKLSEASRQALYAKGWRFYVLLGKDGYRLMCSWDTNDEDVDEFVADLTEALGAE